MTDNIQILVDYIKSGIKSPDEPGRLGVELEHIVVDETGNAIPYNGALGIGTLLEELRQEGDESILGDDSAVIGLSRKGATITLEPAAQLELSSGPYEEIGLIRYDFEEFDRTVTKLLDKRNQRLFVVGYQPRSEADKLHLIPKTRYHFMDEYFSKIGPYGRFMMRGSASTQISIDYYSVEDCLRKLRLATAASPLFALMSDNSAIFEGKPSPHQLMRTEIWRECDPLRCGIVPGVLEPDFTLEDYAAYIMAVPAIYKKDAEGNRIGTDETFAEVWADRPMELEDIEFALSMVFNDVRLKTYIEIRTADAMPIPFVAAYGALIKGLFYHDENLALLEELFADVRAEDIAEAKRSLMGRGYGAEVYGRSAGQLLNLLFDYAAEGLQKNERSYLSPLRSLVASQKTLASMAKRS